ncbi:MAG: GNAT family N-acetyltransferase [Dehalococcoidales bacterium]|jgi:tagatose 1,6-diphosphate aldolase
MKNVILKDYPPLTDGEIAVVVKEKHPAGLHKGWVPFYDFEIRLRGKADSIGRIALRIGNTRDLKMYGGHIGYNINEEYRGHHYAAKGCKLIRQIALDYGLKTLWITCNPDNHASRKTCEALGCEMVEIVDLPEYSDMYQAGERQKCRYRWRL